MWCPHCESTDTSERRVRTELGYRRFRCRTYHRKFNERSGTQFHLLYLTGVVCLVVLWGVVQQAGTDGLAAYRCGPEAGRSTIYSDLAIANALTLKSPYCLSLRCAGFISSVLELMALTPPMPD
ncbi:MAG: transposase [Deltaproteobacteria bacterium]|nr:transposase [Deltaproteobacteria bacterium]